MQTICHNLLNKNYAAWVRCDISTRIIANYCHVVPIWRMKSVWCVVLRV